MNPNSTADSTATETGRLRAQVEELTARVNRLNALRNISYAAIVFGMFAAGIAGWFGARLHKPPPQKLPGISRIETGIVPVELNQQTVLTGVVEFSKPFARKPLVFICEAGHAGVFLVCKTDAISETQFTWAVGAGPVRRDYRSELAWIAIEQE